MSDLVCIICNEGAALNNNLTSNPEMIEHLYECCKERLSLGQTDIKSLTDRLASMSEVERKSVYYHSECRKPIVNKSMIERLRGAKRPLTDDSSSAIRRGPGRPSTSLTSSRPKRAKTLPKSQVCLFNSCSFCPGETVKDLHRVFSDQVGTTLLEIKNNTQDDQVRTCVSELVDAGDASALEKHYHRNCLRYAQRTFGAYCESASVKQVVRSACDVELVLAVQNTLVDDSASLNMAEVNDTYLAILKRYSMEITESGNYRKYLKQLLSERLPNLQFVKSLRKNEPDKVVLPEAVSKAVNVLSAQMDSKDTIEQLQTMARVLRREIMQHRNWSFTGSFEDFSNPPLLQFFLTHLLFGSHALDVLGMRDKEVNKVVDVACQFVVHNTRTDRQVKHQPKANEGFKHTVKTPLSVGLPLAIHSRVRDKNLVKTLSDVYIGSDYKCILDIEKRVEQSVLQRIVETGGFCLPDFVKRDVNIWFAVDNIDLLEDTPTGQNTFHGTVIVLNQREEDGEAVNQPLVFPPKALDPSAQVGFEVKYCEQLVIKPKPVRFETFQLGNRTKLLSNDYTHTWALANYLATEDASDKTLDVPQTENQQQQDIDEQQDQREVESENFQDFDDPILVVKERTQTRKMTAKKEVLTTWAGTKSLLLSHSPENQVGKLTHSEVIAPLFRTSPTDYTTLYTVLNLTQGISAFVVGPGRRTVITLDLDLYSRALQIQQSVGNRNWILRAGVLHITFAALHALGKTLDGSGIDMCAIESGIYTSAALRGIYSGKAYKRGVEYHITTSLALLMMRFDHLFTTLPANEDIPRVQCASFREALHERSPEMVSIYDDIHSWYSEKIKPQEREDQGLKDLSRFMIEYLKQVDNLLELIHACRSGDWEGYLAALEYLIRYFFAHDLLNYARLMPVHLAQMNALEHEDPITWEALKSGDFVVAKSEIPFTRMFTDQTLEQEIKVLKRHGGMVGLSQDEAALDRLLITSPHLARMVKQYLKSFPRVSESSERNEHYQLSGDVAVRTRQNAMKLRQSIELHCEGNPFTVESPLKSLVSSALVPQKAKEDILCYAEKGQKRFEEFVGDRLLPTSKHSLWDAMKKLKLKTFSNWMEKTKVRVGDKVIKLREERELLGRFLIIQGSRPELVPRLEETIGEYEMAVVPRSLCTVDGSLYIPTDKASLMRLIEEVNPQPQLEAPSATGTLHRILVIDAMAVVQGNYNNNDDDDDDDDDDVIFCVYGLYAGLKKTTATLKFSDLRVSFIKRIERMMAGFHEGRVVFDRYLESSLKNKTRQKRSTTSVEFQIHPEMRLTMSIKDLLSSSKSKSMLVNLFANGLLASFSSNTTIKLVVVYDNKIKCLDCEEEHTHEEADTLIPNQVLRSLDENLSQEICVSSPDTDVLVLLLDLVSRGRHGNLNSLKFLTGKGANYREIDVIQRVQAIGIRKCQGLIGLHHFTGADWGGKFVGITKKTWVKAYMALDDDHPAIDCFRELGEGLIQNQLANGELPTQVKDLEEFVCQVYCKTGPTTLPELRWELFRSRNLEGDSYFI